MSFWDKLFFWKKAKPKIKPEPRPEIEYAYFDEWIVEYKGAEIGALKYPAYEEMFWTSYTIIPKKGMDFFFQDVKNWENCVFQYKSKKTGEYAKWAFSNRCKQKYMEDGNYGIRVTMRGLYIVRNK